MGSAGKGEIRFAESQTQYQNAEYIGVSLKLREDIWHKVWKN